MKSTGISNSNAYLEQIAIGHDTVAFPIAEDTPFWRNKIKGWQQRFDPKGKYLTLGNDFKTGARVVRFNCCDNIEIWEWPDYIYIVGLIKGD